jgi:hypothetical protein
MFVKEEVEKIICNKEMELYKDVCKEIERTGEEIVTNRCSSVDKEYALLYSVRKNLDRHLNNPVFQCLVNKLRLQ